jgi:hypothetical protein
MGHGEERILTLSERPVPSTSLAYDDEVNAWVFGVDTLWQNLSCATFTLKSAERPTTPCCRSKGQVPGAGT